MPLPWGFYLLRVGKSRIKGKIEHGMHLVKIISHIYYVSGIVWFQKLSPSFPQCLYKISTILSPTCDREEKGGSRDVSNVPEVTHWAEGEPPTEAGSVGSTAWSLPPRPKAFPRPSCTPGAPGLAHLGSVVWSGLLWRWTHRISSPYGPREEWHHVNQRLLLSVSSTPTPSSGFSFS